MLLFYFETHNFPWILELLVVKTDTFCTMLQHPVDKVKEANPFCHSQHGFENGYLGKGDLSIYI